LLDQRLLKSRKEETRGGKSEVRARGERESGGTTKRRVLRHLMEKIICEGERQRQEKKVENTKGGGC